MNGSVSISIAGIRREQNLQPGDKYELVLEKKNNSLGLNVTVRRLESVFVSFF